MFVNKNSFVGKPNALAGQAGTIKILNQVGTSKSLIRDKGRKALTPGKRISKSGKVYWETRQNRSDSPNKAI